MKVQDVMTTNVRSCRTTDTLNQATQHMWEGDLGCVPVLDEHGQVVGMITDRDISMAAYTRDQRLVEIPVTSAMAKRVFSVKPKDQLATAQQIMRKYAVHRLPVLEDDGHLVGMLSVNDLAHVTVRQAETNSPELKATELAETMAAIRQPRPTATTKVE